MTRCCFPMGRGSTSSDWTRPRRDRRRRRTRLLPRLYRRRCAGCRAVRGDASRCVAAARAMPVAPGQLTAASTAAAPSALPTSPAHDGAPAVHTSPAHDGALHTKRKVTIHVQRTHAPGESSFLYSENGRLGKLKERLLRGGGGGRPSAVTFRFAGVLVEDAHTPLALGMALLISFYLPKKIGVCNAIPIAMSPRV